MKRSQMKKISADCMVNPADAHHFSSRASNTLLGGSDSGSQFASDHQTNSAAFISSGSRWSLSHPEVCCWLWKRSSGRQQGLLCSQLKSFSSGTNQLLLMLIRGSQLASDHPTNGTAFISSDRRWSLSYPEVC